MPAANKMLALALAALLAALAAASSVVQLTPDNFDAVVNGKQHALVAFTAPWCGHCKSLKPTFEELGDAFKHAKSEVVIANVDADAHRALGERYQVQGFPTLKFFAKGAPTKSPEDYSGGRALEDLASFVEGKAGVKAKIHREPSHVVELTSRTFDQIVMDPAKNVLIAFTAPWCGHCKSLKPTWAQLAASFATEENVVVANLDATAHGDVAAKFGVEGYPTIKFFPAGSKTKTAEPYDGGRAEQDLVDFLNSRAGTQRQPGGGLSESAGIVDVMAASVRAVAAAVVRKQPTTDALASAKTAAKAVAAPKRDAKAAALYVKALDKFAQGGVAYVTKERKRLAKLLEADNVSLEKRDLFTVRRNILGEIEKAAKNVGKGSKDEL